MGDYAGPDRCKHCGKKKSLLDYNYAGFFISKDEYYAFPYKITIPRTPGPQSQIFICDKCVSAAYPVHCKTHGKIAGDYKYGKPPKCYRCENDLKSIKEGIIPPSFKALAPISKIHRRDGYYLDENIWLAISETDEINLVGNKLLLSDKIENVSYRLSTKSGRVQLVGIPTGNNSITEFEIDLISEVFLKKGKGPWIVPWNGIIRRELGIDKIDKLYFSKFNYSIVAQNSIQNSTYKSKFIFWSLKNNIISSYGTDIEIPSLEHIDSWTFEHKDEIPALKLFFSYKSIPSLLKIKEPILLQGIDAIESIKLRDSKNIASTQVPSLDNSGIFEFKFDNDNIHRSLIVKKNNRIWLKVLSNNEKQYFDCGFVYKSHLLLINSKKGYFARSVSKSEHFYKLLQSFKEPCSVFGNEDFRFAICFDGNLDDEIKLVRFFDSYFEIDNQLKVRYSKILDTNCSKGESSWKLSISLDETESLKSGLTLVGPDKYIYDIWKLIDTRRIENVTASLTTNDLYEKYNDLKKQNLLIGLLSDIILLNKELELDISIEDLKKQLRSISAYNLSKNTKLYNQTIKKLIIYTTQLPKLKQHFERLSAFYPYYQLQNEITFISEAFGDEIAKKIENTEWKFILNASRKNIGMIQTKVQKSFSEIERILAPVENIFLREELQKDFIAKVATYAAHGGQAILVGAIMATGAATGGVGILAGMLGIRAMSDCLSSLNKDIETTAIIKSAAEKAFSWWNTFRATFPVTIYEVGKTIDDENNRCVKRDYEIFDYLKKNNAISVKRLDKTLENKIIESTKVRFNEILSGTGILFNEIANKIEEESMTANFPSNNNFLNVPQISS
jgi:hypothetical protein